MAKVQTKHERRTLRKALGPVAADLVQVHDVRLRSHGEILRRGFWGRFKWLIFGR